ncbi:MAG: bifunctional UDP-N-acetylglucosamine diphosphorylase/glucosamine-1-phosphate N-acetyltransferase GlmU [Rhodospirillales bacterium]|nr:bifunctional UDP-N-acetylglucosamine diphosphorylase/glucosamine-1-phosphate N-acetyltransferase GlmU [Rhodospirillales bacterium]MCB9965566.1 bifunctional UDP-N-acetylglucosamine diphosphorylase/glucosamine-1-phosphate N-acetyltransferase GlmU [Rhodospirillales bacterium]MCB9979807.1 bifunctional UDP-N-acetylglucosamine diphosphorylase/glucosamine-1-phosphate N-acetyltransferase GlmU [Rhodospirillales bacterium]
MTSPSSDQSALTIIILAAGKGTRMRSDLPKVLHSLAGRPMINWVIDVAEQVGPAQIIVVIGPDMDAVKEAVAPWDVVVQTERLGTADAVLMAYPHIRNKSGKVLILMGDEPFLPLEALQNMVEKSAPSIMAFSAENPAGFGRMIQKQDGTLQAIVEEKDASSEQREVTLCNAGNFCLEYDGLAKWLPRISNQNAQKEYYLTDLPEIAAEENISFEIVNIGEVDGWGVNDRIQLAQHESFIQDVLRETLLENGVTMIDPQTVYLSWDTEIGPDVVIEPNVVIGPDVVIEGHVQIKAFSHLEGARIGKYSVIGPFARLRPGADLAENVKIGNFVEVKNATLQKGVKANHHGYIGDADVGEGTNFSCGAITVNYDGYKKHRTKIGRHVMVGSNVSLIAPIEIGDGAFIGAGSTIAENIPAEALGLERSKTVLIKDWAKLHREQNKK